MSRAGELRWTATVQSPPTTVLPSGTPDPAGWTPVFTRRVKIEEITGTKSNDGAGQKQAVAWFDVKMRLTSVPASYRLVITGRPHDGLTIYVSSVRHTLTDTFLTCVKRAN